MCRYTSTARRWAASGFFFDEDTFGDDLIDLWDYAEDDYGVENLTFGVSVLADIPQVEVSLDQDGHHLDLMAMDDWNGQFHFNVWAVNRHNVSALSPNITVTVRPVNDPPVLADLNNETATEWKNFVYSVEASDMDFDVLTFWDDTELFDIDPVTGIIDFTPDEDDDGAHLINITVSDGGANDTGWFLLNVEEADNGPVFDEFPALVIVMEDEVTIVNVTATDPEGDVVTYAISPSMYPIDPSTGAISFDPTRPTTRDIIFTVTATANGLTSTLGFDLKVEPVNDLPEIISMRVTTAVYGQRLIEDVDVFFEADVFDEDGDDLTYIWTTDDETLSHELSFKKKLHAGEYNITFSVSDSDEVVTRTTSLTVYPVQPPPPPPPPPPKPDPRPVISQPEAAAAVTTVAIVTVATAVVVGTEIGKFGLFFFFAPLFSRIKKEKALDSFTRGKIYGAILMEPGISYNVLKEMTGVGNGNLAYHLKVLERTGYVVIRRDGFYKRFYPREAKIPKSHKVLSKIQKVILSTIVDEPGMTQTEVAEAIEVRRQVANYHIKKLVNMNLVSLEKVGNVKRCYPNDVEIKGAAIDLGYQDFDVLGGKALGEEG